jgi:hypothetical protein
MCVDHLLGDQELGSLDLIVSKTAGRGRRACQGINEA